MVASGLGPYMGTRLVNAFHSRATAFCSENLGFGAFSALALAANILRSGARSSWESAEFDFLSESDCLSVGLSSFSEHAKVFADFLPIWLLCREADRGSCQDFRNSKAPCHKRDL